MRKITVPFRLGSMFLGFVVLTEGVMMLGLMVVVRSGMMVAGGRMVMMSRRMIVMLCHL